MLACAVCGLTGTSDTAIVYFAMTVMLSALPLAMIGGVSWWLYRRSRGPETRS